MVTSLLNSNNKSLLNFKYIIKFPFAGNILVMATRLLPGIFAVTAAGFGTLGVIALATDKFRASKAQKARNQIKKLKESGDEEPPKTEKEVASRLFLISRGIVNFDEILFEETMRRIMKFEESETEEMAKRLQKFIANEIGEMMERVDKFNKESGDKIDKMIDKKRIDKTLKLIKDFEYSEYVKTRDRISKFKKIEAEELSKRLYTFQESEIEKMVKLI